MRKYYNFTVTALIVVLFIFVLSKTSIINSEAIFLTSYKYILYSGVAFIVLATIIDQIIDKEYKLGLNLLLIVYLAPLLVNIKDLSFIATSTLIFSVIFFIIFFTKTFFPKEKQRFILPPGTFKKSHYNGFLILLSGISFASTIVFFIVDAWYFKLLTVIVFFLLVFGAMMLYTFVTQLPMLNAHQKFIIDGNYNNLKDNLNKLRKDYLHKESINQINLILINYGIDKDINYVDSLASDVFKPSLIQFEALYNQTMATYYLNKKDYLNAKPLIDELKASTNPKLQGVGKRFDIVVRLENNEDVSLSEIDEIADYSNAINTLATYQLYAKFYEKRDYNKYMEYVNKANQVKNYQN